MLEFIKGDDSLIIKFGGALFQEYIKACKEHGAKYKKTLTLDSGETLDHVWEADLICAKQVVEALIKVEPVPFPSWINDFTPETDPEFIKIRGSIDPSLVKSEWKGEYQKKAVQKGITQNRMALFHEMGLGKSFEIQTIINHLMKWGRIQKYVIISPPEGVINIAREAVRFNSFNLTWDDIYIVDTQHRDPFENPKTLTVMTYRGLIMLFDDFYKRVKKVKSSPQKIVKSYIPWEKLGKDLALILDESPAIKSNKSKTFKIVDRIKSKFTFRYIMTGTPAPKYAADLWTQFRFLQESCVPDYMTFLRSIAEIGTRFSDTAVRFYHPDKVDKFLESVEYLVDRADLKSAGIDLPPLQIVPIYCQLPEKQTLIYQSIVKQTVATIQEKEGKVTRRALQNKYAYMSLALHDPLVILGSDKLDKENTNENLMNLLNGWKLEDNGKYEVCLSLLERNFNDGKKTILFSGHPRIIGELAKKLQKYKPYTLHAGTVVDKGETVAERNSKVVDLFKNDKDSWVLIANYMVLKTAVNLTEAPRQIYWDRDWNADTFAQAVKRSHRLGQTESVIINPLIFAHSLEEKNDREIKNRMRFSDETWIKNTEIKIEEQLQPLSLDEVQNIFKGVDDE